MRKHMYFNKGECVCECVRARVRARACVCLRESRRERENLSSELLQVCLMPPDTFSSSTRICISMINVN